MLGLGLGSGLVIGLAVRVRLYTTIYLLVGVTALKANCPTHEGNFPEEWLS